MAVHEQYDAEWVLKVDDDVYLNPGRLMLALEQWQVMGVDYVGCMKHGDVRQDPSHRCCILGLQASTLLLAFSSRQTDEPLSM